MLFKKLYLIIFHLSCLAYLLTRSDNLREKLAALALLYLSFLLFYGFYRYKKNYCSKKNALSFYRLNLKISLGLFLLSFIIPVVISPFTTLEMIGYSLSLIIINKLFVNYLKHSP